MTFDDWWDSLIMPPDRAHFRGTLGELDKFDTHGATERVSYRPSVDLSPYLSEEHIMNVLCGNFNEQLSSYIERLVKQGAKLVPVSLQVENGRLTLYYYITSK